MGCVWFWLYGAAIVSDVSLESGCVGDGGMGVRIWFGIGGRKRVRGVVVIE
jgi:hypothetical protein